jgi:hypothetical protein
MSLLISGIYSFKFNSVYTKDLPVPYFDIIEDKLLNDTNQIRLNLKVKLYPSKHDGQYKCNRSLDYILVYNGYSNTDNDLSNIVNNKQPTGYNPVLTDDYNNIYKLNTDFVVSGNLILTTIKKQLYLTFCEIYSGIESNKISDGTFGSFELRSGNPIFNTNSLDVTTECILDNNSIKSLLHKTIYIVISLNISTSLLLSDSYTNIVLDGGNFYICSNVVPYRETAHFITSGTTCILTCVITPDEITTYYNNETVPKNGLYFNYTVDTDVVLTVSSSSIFAINIYNEVHTANKIAYNVLALQGEYNL